MARVTARVSVCVPVYNAEAFLAEAIESVLAQDFTDWELVIVDDASSDRSLEIAQRYAADDERITVHRNATNQGAAATWNRAVALSAGPYVKLLCNDDIIKPRCLSTQVAVLDADEAHAIGMVTGLRDIVAADGSAIHRNHGLRGLPRTATTVGRRQLVLGLLRNGGNPLGEPSTVLLRREALDRAGGFPADWQYLIDLATYAEISRSTDIALIRTSLATFRLSAGSWSSSLAKRQAEETRRIIRALTADGDVPSWRRWQGYVMARVMQSLRHVATEVSHRRERRA